MHTTVFLETDFFLLPATSVVAPAVFAGIGVNLISHVLIEHLFRAERNFDRTHPQTER